MLNGPSWGTVRECLEFDGEGSGEGRGQHDVFAGIEHRQRSDAAQEEWNTWLLLMPKPPKK